MHKGPPLWRVFWPHLPKLDMHMLFDPAIPVLENDKHTGIFMAVLLTKAKHYTLLTKNYQQGTSEINYD